MKETKIQSEFLMPLFCRPEEQGGMGYIDTPTNIVSQDLFIPSHLAQFVRSADPALWKRLLKRFSGDERGLQNALKDAVKERLSAFRNVAIGINQNKSISFQGESVPLFYVSGTELRADEDFKKNIFAAVAECNYTVKCSGGAIHSFRPDITFFLNGIYIGYLELKTISQGQSAEKQGREKITTDYLLSVKKFVELQKSQPALFSERSQVLGIFESAIHLVTTDVDKTYVLRALSGMYGSVEPHFHGEIPDSIETVRPEILSGFKPYPASADLEDSRQRCIQAMRALYSKKMIEKEILYYNFIAYKYKRDALGKVRTTNTGTLVAPRPKQKFGCDKILARVQEMLDHETEPDYYINCLRGELGRLGVSPEKTEEIIAQRLKYRNNQHVYSLLMQYAAGFGKSNIIGWTALQLKDYRYHGQRAYDKVMLVVDRLQLRDQLDTNMRNMNIDNSMYVEATDQPTFVAALSSTKPIIVVNIQKFLELQSAIDQSGERLHQMRVAFLIDEIHRSNSGDTNAEMINIFERLQESFTTSDGTICPKKNLIVGFTATPSDETLIRFGEFRSASTIPLWIPFDSYTMREAIEDGYILDPTEHILPYCVPFEFDLPPELEGKDSAYISKSKAKIYEFEPRMRKISEMIVDRLVSLVYGTIRGEGKAMLATSSIPIAIRYFEIIRELYAQKCREKRYERYKDAPIVIVYSDSQSHESCSSYNSGLSENKAVERFKNSKNGLIIVVDKLQTGFDEPKLHTLFLDKEISDINAIQTISRINRKCKYKTDCHIVDFSWRNVNVGNIAAAFKKYCDIAVSTFNPEEELSGVEKYYQILLSSVPSSKWYNDYRQFRDNADFVLSMESWITDWIKECFAQENSIKAYNEEHKLNPGDSSYKEPINPARVLRQTVGSFAATVRMLHNIVELEPKYEDEIFAEFWQRYCNIYHNVVVTMTHVEGYTYDVVDSNELPGFTIEEPPQTSTRRTSSHGSGTGRIRKEKSMGDIIDMLEKLNASEKLSALQAKLWLTEIGKMFESLMSIDDLCAYLRDDQFSQEEKLGKYVIAQNRYKRSLSRRTDLCAVDRLKKLLSDNEAQLYATFYDTLRDPGTTARDFDFNLDEPSPTVKTTTPAPLDVAFDKEALIALVQNRLRPPYDEGALRLVLRGLYAEDFAELGNLPNFEDSLDSLFYVLDAVRPGTYNEPYIELRESLNLLCRSRHLSFGEKNGNLLVLFMNYEGFLKKMYFLLNGYKLLDDDGRDVSLTSVLRSFPDLLELKNTSDQGLQKFSIYLRRIIKMRNDRAHGNFTIQIDSSNIDRYIQMTIDMYLYISAKMSSDLALLPPNNL